MPLAALFETQEIVPGGEARYTPSTYTSTDAALDFVNSEIGTAPLTTLSFAGFTILTTAAEALIAPPNSRVRKLQRKITIRPTKPYPSLNPRIYTSPSPGVRKSAPAGSIGPASARRWRSTLHTVRRTNADALPRLGAGYFSGVMPSAGMKTDIPIRDRSLPADLDSQPQSLKLPSRSYLSNTAQTAPAANTVSEG